MLPVRQRCITLDNSSGGTKPQLELKIVDDQLPFLLYNFVLPVVFSNGTHLVTVIANNVTPRQGDAVAFV